MTCKTETKNGKEYKVLYADEGKVLTNGKVYAKVIYLCAVDKAENYREITEKEFERVRK